MKEQYNSISVEDRGYRPESSVRKWIACSGMVAVLLGIGGATGSSVGQAPTPVELQEQPVSTAQTAGPKAPRTGAIVQEHAPSPFPTVVWIAADDQDKCSSDELRSAVMSAFAAAPKPKSYTVDNALALGMSAQIPGLDKPMGSRKDTYEASYVEADAVLVERFVVWRLNGRKTSTEPALFEDPGTYFDFGLGDGSPLAALEKTKPISANHLAAVSIAVVSADAMTNAKDRKYLAPNSAGPWDFDYDEIDPGCTPTEGNIDVYKINVPGTHISCKTDGKRHDTRGGRVLIPTESLPGFAPQDMEYRGSLGVRMPTLGPADALTVMVARSYFDRSGDARRRVSPDILASFTISEARRQLVEERGTFVLCSGFGPKDRDNKLQPKFVLVLRANP
jgi:hypothetical protein